VFGATGLIIAAYAAVDSLRSIFRIYSLIVAAERGIELAVAVVLISLLFFSSRYGIRIQRAPFLLATGLCFYSVVQTLNNTLYHGLTNYFPWWNNFRIIAFQIALFLWIVALTGPSGSDDKPVQGVPNLYEKHAEEVSGRLRAIDKDLEEIMRK